MRKGWGEAGASVDEGGQILAGNLQFSFQRVEGMPPAWQELLSSAQTLGTLLETLLGRRK